MPGSCITINWHLQSMTDVCFAWSSKRRCWGCFLKGWCCGVLSDAASKFLPCMAPASHSNSRQGANSIDWGTIYWFRHANFLQDPRTAAEIVSNKHTLPCSALDGRSHFLVAEANGAKPKTHTHTHTVSLTGNKKMKLLKKKKSCKMLASPSRVLLQYNP